MKLYDLVKKLDWEVIKENASFLGNSEKEIIKLRRAWNSIQGTVINEYSEKIVIGMDVDSFYELNENEIRVFGFNDVEEDIDISFYKWEDWLNFKIDDGLFYYLSEEEILINCIKEMMTWGLTNSDVMANTGYKEMVSNKNKKLIYVFNKVGE